MITDAVIDRLIATRREDVRVLLVRRLRASYRRAIRRTYKFSSPWWSFAFWLMLTDAYAGYVFLRYGPAIADAFVVLELEGTRT